MILIYLYVYAPTSSKLIPVLVATKFSVMKLIERAGLMNISATKFISVDYLSSIV